MSRWVFDIETDGYLHQTTRCWIVAAFNLDTLEMKYWLEGDLGWQKVFDEATLLIGHHILGFDLPALAKLFKWKPSKKCKLHDTLVLSQVLDYRRFGFDGHSLERWGEYLEFPKGKFDDFSQYSEEMRVYCLRDVELNVRIYEILMDEFFSLREKSPLIKTYMQAETAVAKWNGMTALHGWPFDTEAALELLVKLEDKLNEAHEQLESKLGFKVVAVDKCKGVVEPKYPKWTKEGFYQAFIAKWFNIDPCSGFDGEERMVEGPFSRIEIVPLSLDSTTDVKIFLERNGWEPTEWNTKFNPETRRKEPTSPKITEDSLEFLGGDGKLYMEFLTVRSRFGILKTWIDNVTEDGILFGNFFSIGTPSMRSTHKVIVNVPSVDSAWGEEMRKLFRVRTGWKMIGCDSSGNQARGLAYYLGDEEFINVLLNDDIHEYNKNAANKVLEEMGETIRIERGQAKRILYAFLFGASGGKLWLYVSGTVNASKGNEFKRGFVSAVPGFQALLDKLENIFGSTSKRGYGYIPSLAGNRIYVDSYHKLLVYLLQSLEKITCSAAVMLTMERLEEKDIPYIPLIMYHDEEDFMVPEEFAEEAAAIGQQAFIDGPKLFGVDIMDGNSKIGDTWYDVH
jgi:DNA polymerase-1